MLRAKIACCAARNQPRGDCCAKRFFYPNVTASWVPYHIHTVLRCFLGGSLSIGSSERTGVSIARPQLTAVQNPAGSRFSYYCYRARLADIWSGHKSDREGGGEEGGGWSLALAKLQVPALILARYPNFMPNVSLE